MEKEAGMKEAEHNFFFTWPKIVYVEAHVFIFAANSFQLDCGKWLTSDKIKSFAIIFFSLWIASQTYDGVYRHVANGDSKLALVDSYTATQHEALFSRHFVNVGSAMSKSVVYGVVLPNNSAERKKCIENLIKRKQQKLYEIVKRYIHPDKVSTSVFGFFSLLFTLRGNWQLLSEFEVFMSQWVTSQWVMSQYV